MKTTTVVVMTKESIEGRVKTRLIPDMGAAAATALHVEMVRETLRALIRGQFPVLPNYPGPKPQPPKRG